MIEKIGDLLLVVILAIGAIFAANYLYLILTSLAVQTVYVPQGVMVL